MGIADKFLDPRIRNKPNLTIVNLHNFETGRQVKIAKILFILLEIFLNKSVLK